MDKNYVKYPPQKMSFKVDKGVGHRARLGLLILESDQSIEEEFRILTGIEGVSTYHSRLANDTIITPESLSKMAQQIPSAAKLFPEYLNLQVIGYGCTSGSTVIGEKKVENIISNIHPGVSVTNPLTAAKEALKVLNIRRLGLVTPYSPDVTESMEANFKQAGFNITAVGSFFEEDDKVVGKIDPKSILNATLKIGAYEECDGVFISCTNLRALPIIERAETLLRKPVTASNHALAWHMIRLAGIEDKINGFGKLFKIHRTELSSY